MLIMVTGICFPHPASSVDPSYNAMKPTATATARLFEAAEPRLGPGEAAASRTQRVTRPLADPKVKAFKKAMAAPTKGFHGPEVFRCFVPFFLQICLLGFGTFEEFVDQLWS